MDGGYITDNDIGPDMEEMNERVKQQKPKTRKYRKKKQSKAKKSKSKTLEINNKNNNKQTYTDFKRIKKLANHLKHMKIKGLATKKSKNLHRSILDKYGKKRTKKNMVAMLPELYGEDGFPQHIKTTGFNYGNNPQVFKSQKNPITQNYINKQKSQVRLMPTTLADVLLKHNFSKLSNNKNENENNNNIKSGYESDNEDDYIANNEYEDYHNMANETNNYKELNYSKSFSSSSQSNYSMTQPHGQKPVINKKNYSITQYTNSSTPYIHQKITQNGKTTVVTKIPK
jgi:hypothetical protein